MMTETAVKNPAAKARRTGGPTPEVDGLGELNNTPLRAAASWIIMAVLVFAVDGVYTFVKARAETARHIQILHESRHQKFRHQGRVYSKKEAIHLVEWTPHRKAVPHLTLAALLAMCAAWAFRRPLRASLAALAVAVFGCAVVAAITSPLRFERIMLYAFIAFVLLLGTKASLGYVRRFGSPATEDPAG